MNRFAPFAAAVLAAALVPFPGQAQLPQATPEQREAGRRVSDIQMGVEEAVVRRGESLRLEPRLVDADGNPVAGAVAVLFAPTLDPPLIPVTGGPVELTAGDPGQVQIVAMVLVPVEEGQTRMGIPGVRMLSRFAVEVQDWPVASIDVDAPSGAYVGTSIQVGGRVLTDRGTEHVSAEISWRSTDPEVAFVTTGGVVTGMAPGSATLVASTESGVEAEHTLRVMENPVRALTLTPSSARARTGDVVEFDVQATDAAGRPVTDVPIDFSVSGLEARRAFAFDDGTFVAEEAGPYRVIASAGATSAAAVVEVVAREQPTPVEFVAHGATAHVATSDLWVFEGRDGRDYAYTGTHAMGGGQRMFVWDVTNPASVQLVDSVVVDARVVNDVKVNPDATWAIITREGASTRRNGIVVLDLADPAHPTVMAELTDSLTGGIHNVWINEDVVYAVNNGTNAMSIIDLADPANPRYVGRWEVRPGETDKSLHDVWARDGYAYLSYWDDGLVILDVGAGTHGGTALVPTFVSKIAYPEGNTHVAWRDRDYVFLGDEIGTQDGMRGFIHVVDVSDIDNPVQVAKYEVPEAGAHNVWVEDGTLYIAYYQGGLRVVDVSGELRGDLYRQGREIGLFRTSAPEGQGIRSNQPMAWGPQVFKGHVFVSDMNSGLWVIKHEKPRRVTF